MVHRRKWKGRKKKIRKEASPWSGMERTGEPLPQRDGGKSEGQG